MQQTRLEEVLNHETIFKEVGASDEKLKMKYLSDINISLALIFDEIRALRMEQLSIHSEQPTATPSEPVFEEVNNIQE